VFSKFFSAGGCDLRIGVSESFDTLCIYLESDQAMAPSSSSGGGRGVPLALEPGVLGRRRGGSGRQHSAHTRRRWHRLLTWTAISGCGTRSGS